MADTRNLSAASPQIRSEVRVNRKFLNAPIGTLPLSSSFGTLRLALNLLLLPQHSPHDVLSLMISRSLLYTAPSALSFLLSIPALSPVLSPTFISPICRSCVRSLPLSLSASSPPLPARFVHTVADRQLRKTDDRPTDRQQTDRQTKRERDRQIDRQI